MCARVRTRRVKRKEKGVGLALTRAEKASQLEERVEDSEERVSKEWPKPAAERGEG